MVAGSVDCAGDRDLSRPAQSCGAGSGDAVTLEVDGARRLYRITAITDGAARAMQARAFDPLVYDAPPAFTPMVAVGSPKLVGPPYPVVLDLAIARDATNTLQHLAVFADPWPGALALWRDKGGSYGFERMITRCAIIGETLDALAPGPVARIDRGAALRVQIRGCALSSVSEMRMLAGANVAALRGADGAWEILGFASAELVGEGTYRLSRLLRGLGGEEHLAKRQLPAGAAFVLLDEAVTPLVAGLSQVGAAHGWRVGPADRDYADASCVAFEATAGGKSLRPYAPARVRAARGRYVKLLDADDLLIGGITPLLCAELDRVQGDLIKGELATYRVGEIAPEAATLGTVRVLDDALYTVIATGIANTSGTLFRRSAFVAAGGCDETVFVQDFSFFLRMARRGRYLLTDVPVACIPETADGRVSGLHGQTLHDVNRVLLNYVTADPGLSAMYKCLAMRRAAGRTWKWARRLRGVGLFSKPFLVHLVSRLPIPALAPWVLRNSCVPFYADTKLRFPGTRL